MNPDKHRNNSASVEPSAHLSSDSFADPNSQISGRSSVLASSIINSQLVNSVVVNCQVNASLLVDSTVADSSIGHSRVENVVIAGLLGQKPDIHGVVLENCTIEGGVLVVGPWELRGYARIHEGEWYRAPRFKVITSETGIVACLTECVNGRALIACRCHDMRRWQRSGPRLGRLLGWPAQLVRETWLTFEEWLDHPDRNPFLPSGS